MDAKDSRRAGVTDAMERTRRQQTLLVTLARHRCATVHPFWLVPKALQPGARVLLIKLRGELAPLNGSIGIIVGGQPPTGRHLPVRILSPQGTSGRPVTWSLKPQNLLPGLGETREELQLCAELHNGTSLPQATLRRFVSDGLAMPSPSPAKNCSHARAVVMLEQFSTGACRYGCEMRGDERHVWVHRCRGHFICAGSHESVFCGYPSVADGHYSCNCDGRALLARPGVVPETTPTAELMQSLRRPPSAPVRAVLVGTTPFDTVNLVLLAEALPTRERIATKGRASKWLDCCLNNFLQWAAALVTEGCRRANEHGNGVGVMLPTALTPDRGYFTHTLPIIDVAAVAALRELARTELSCTLVDSTELPAGVILRPIRYSVRQLAGSGPILR